MADLSEADLTTPDFTLDHAKEALKRRAVPTDFLCQTCKNPCQRQKNKLAYFEGNHFWVAHLGCCGKTFTLIFLLEEP